MKESLFVDFDYVMNPEDDDLLFDGTELRPEMVVLVADPMCRVKMDREINDYEKLRALEANRWCTVIRVNVRDRFSEDNNGVIVRSSPLVQLMAEYPDGVRMKRTYDASYAWIVKKFSITSEET